MISHQELNIDLTLPKILCQLVIDIRALATFILIKFEDVDSAPVFGKKVIALISPISDDLSWNLNSILTISRHVRTYKSFLDGDCSAFSRLRMGKRQ